MHLAVELEHRVAAHHDRALDLGGDVLGLGSGQHEGNVLSREVAVGLAGSCDHGVLVDGADDDARLDARGVEEFLRAGEAEARTIETVTREGYRRAPVRLRRAAQSWSSDSAAGSWPVSSPGFLPFSALPLAFSGGWTSWKTSAPR